MDRMFKETGHENVQMPMFIPESLLNVEKNMLKDLLPKLLGLHMGDKKSLKKECVLDQQVKYYSVTIIKNNKYL